MAQTSGAPLEVTICSMSSALSARAALSGAPETPTDADAPDLPAPGIYIWGRRIYVAIAAAIAAVTAVTAIAVVLFTST